MSKLMVGRNNEQPKLDRSPKARRQPLPEFAYVFCKTHFAAKEAMFVLRQALLGDCMAQIASDPLLFSSAPQSQIKTPLAFQHSSLAVNIVLMQDSAGEAWVMSLEVRLAEISGAVELIVDEIYLTFENAALKV